MRILALITALSLVLVACAPAATQPTAEPPTDTPPTDVPPTEAPPTEAPPTDVPPTEAPPTDSVVSRQPLPAWASLTLTDVNTGETFTLADFEDRTTYVQLMATWCTNCLASQRRLRDEVLPAAGEDTVQFVSVDIQTQIENETLRTYTERNEFDWRFAVSSQEFLNAMVAEFGRTTTNPPSRPHFVIYPDGTYSNLITGVTSTDDELALILGTNEVGG